MFVGGAIIADVLLQPGDSFPPPSAEGAQLVIPVSGVNLKGAHGFRIRSSPGDVAWVPADFAHGLTNAGRDPARFIIVEFHADTPFAPLPQ
jgi:quercetin dioxygenase-like cupin family protein